MSVYCIKSLSVLLSIILAVMSIICLLNSKKESPVFEASEITEKENYSMGEYTPEKYDLYISEKGNDSWSGTLAQPDSEGTDGPLKTISAAKEKLKQYSYIDNLENPTVWIRGGTYYIDKTLEFNSEDLSNVTFRAYPGENVVFNASKPIGGWEETTVNSVTAWVCDTKGISFNALYNNEQALSLARYPEKGYLYVDKAEDEDALDATSTYYKQHSAFYSKSGDIEAFKNITDVNVRILHWWKDEFVTINSFDSSTNKVNISRPTAMTINADDKYFLENVYEALNEPGEYYLDKANQKLYYIPLETDNINTTVLYAGETQQFIKIDNADNITFKDISFKNSEWNIPHDNKTPDFSQAAIDTTACIEVNKATGISFIGCNFNNIGGGGIKFGINVKNSTIESCSFVNIGAQAIFVQGNNVQLDDEAITKNIKIYDNYIEKYSRRFFNACGILIINANSCDVSNNEIHDGYYTGISVGWVWGYGYNVTDNNKICNNLIYDIGQGWLSDMGGIYTLGMQPNTVISGNVIHNVAADPGQGGYGGWGIYLDEGSSYITVENNLVYDCGSQGFHQHYGKENIVRNNIFALNKNGQIRVTREEEHISAYFTGNIIVGNNSAMYVSVQKGKFKDSNNLYWDYKNHEITMSSKDENGSLSISKRYYRLDMNTLGFYQNATYKDPWFKDAQNGDFTLATNSPAIKDIGFKPWDCNQAGNITNKSN